MKIYLDKKFLQNISKGEHELLISEEQKEEMERIKGMLDQNIRFCSLVTGYRGTGKSSFVHYTLKQYKDEKNGENAKDGKKIVVISYNAAKYKNYKTFIRRFIRELYFRMKENDAASSQLKKMYFQTFFDVKEVYRNNVLRQDDHSTEKEKSTVFVSKTDVSGLLGAVLKMGVYFVPAGLILKIADKTVYGVAPAIVWILFAVLADYLTLSRERIRKRKQVKRTGIQNIDEQSGFAETLYDKEIAEYYIFDELDKICKDNINLVFVIDELDKVEDKELDKIFHDLKPLLLSCNCNFILIAGRNMDKYLFNSQKDTDSIAKTIFTNRIYIPLGTVQDMMDFGKQFVDGKNEDEKTQKFSSDRNIQYYFQQKVFESKGVKRAFIHSVLSDLRWDNKENPYIDVSETAAAKESMVLFSVLQKMEETICREYTGPKRDELLQNTYCWIEEIRENKHKEFTQEDITGSEETIAENAVYSNTAEKLNLVQDLFDFMVEEEILEKSKRNEKCYKWKSKMAIREADSRNPEYEELTEIDKEYVEIFAKHWDEIGNIIYHFSAYNGIIDLSKKGITYHPNDYEILLKEMLSEDEFEDLQMSDSFINIKKLYDPGIEKGDIEQIKNYIRKMPEEKVLLAERLMRFTIDHTWGPGIINHSKRYQKFDIIYQRDKNDITTFFEIKYYKEYMRAIDFSSIHKMLVEISHYAAENDMKKYQLKLVVFTNSADESGIKRLKDRECDLRSFFSEEVCNIDACNIDVNLVPLNDYEVFRRQLDSVLK